MEGRSEGEAEILFPSSGQILDAHNKLGWVFTMPLLERGLWRPTNLIVVLQLSIVLNTENVLQFEV